MRARIPQCPGLEIGEGTVTFTDSLGGHHDLLEEPLLSLKEAAPRFASGRSYSWLRRQIASGEIYPVFQTGHHKTEIYAIAIRDWQARQHTTAK